MKQLFLPFLCYTTLLTTFTLAAAGSTPSEAYSNVAKDGGGNSNNYVPKKPLSESESSQLDELGKGLDSSRALATPAVPPVPAARNRLVRRGIIDEAASRIHNALSGGSGTAENLGYAIARDIRDWEVENVMLLATVDGSLYARDRRTGAPLWNLQSEQPVVETIDHRGKDEEGYEEEEGQEDLVWIVEPRQGGGLYFFSERGGLTKLDFTVKKLVEETPYSPETIDPRDRKIYSGDRRTITYSIDIATGRVLQMYSTGGSKITDDNKCRLSSSLGNEDADECDVDPNGQPIVRKPKAKNSGKTILMGRTEYTVNIDSVYTGKPLWTIRYVEWGPNNSDRDLAAQHLKSPDDRYVYPIWDGQVYGFHHFQGITAERPYFQHKFSSPVIRVFDLMRSLSGDGQNLILLPQPVGPNSDDVVPGSDDMTYVGVTEGGGWFAMSKERYPFVNSNGYPADCYKSDGEISWSEKPYKQRINSLKGLHQISNPRKHGAPGHPRPQHPLLPGLPAPVEQHYIDQKPARTGNNDHIYRPIDNAQQHIHNQNQYGGQHRNQAHYHQRERLTLDDHAANDGSFRSFFKGVGVVELGFVLVLIALAFIVRSQRNMQKMLLDAQLAKENNVLNNNTNAQQPAMVERRRTDEPTPRAQEAVQEPVVEEILNEKVVDEETPLLEDNSAMEEDKPTVEDEKDSGYGSRTPTRMDSNPIPAKENDDAKPMTAEKPAKSPSQKPHVRFADLPEMEPESQPDSEVGEPKSGSSSSGGGAVAAVEGKTDEPAPAATPTKKKKTHRGYRGGAAKKKKAAAAAAAASEAAKEAGNTAGTETAKILTASTSTSTSSTPKTTVLAHAKDPESEQEAPAELDPEGELLPQVSAIVPHAKTPPMPDVKMFGTNNSVTSVDGSACLRVGSLQISEEILGYGSHGTIVYRGSFEDRDVAVKRMLNTFYDLAAHEVRLLQESDFHRNVIRYYCKQEHRGFMYIALELCEASLHDIITVPQNHMKVSAELDPKECMRQMATGIKHLHSLKIVHRDLKPQNILVQRAKLKPKQTVPDHPRLVISDFGLCKKLDGEQSSFRATTAQAAGTTGWRAPELLTDSDTTSSTSATTGTTPENSATIHTDTSLSTSDAIVDPSTNRRATRAIDIFSLGCVFYFTLTSGQHPFGDRYLREANIVRSSFTLHHLDTLDAASRPLAKDLISRMIRRNPKERPTAEEVLRHPYFWDEATTLSFLLDCSDYFEALPRDPPHPHLQALESLSPTILAASGGDWYKKLDKTLIENLGKYRKYQGNKILDLLRVIRNKKHHFLDLPDNVRRQFGSGLPGGFLGYFTGRFPGLVVGVWEVGRRCWEENWEVSGGGGALGGYFEGSVGGV